MTLRHYLRTHPYIGPFRTVPMYSVPGDFVQVYFEDESAYGEQLTPEVTLERAMSDNRIVGVKIFGVGRLVDEKRANEP